VCRSAWCWSEGEPLRRGVLGIGTLAAVGTAAFVWWPNGDYRPIQPTERGTIQAAVRDLRALPTGRPALTPQRERELGGAPTERERRRAQLPTTGTPSDKTQTTPKSRTTPSATTTSTTSTTTSTTDTTTTPTTPFDTTPTETLPGDTTTTTTPVDPTQTTTVPGTTTPGAATTTPGAATPAPAPGVTTTPP